MGKLEQLIEQKRNELEIVYYQSNDQDVEKELLRASRELDKLILAYIKREKDEIV